MAILGIAIALLVDVVLPAALVLLLLRSTQRGGKAFWWWFGSIYGFFALCVIAAIPRIWWYDGLGVVVGTIFAAPGSVVPAVFNSTVIHFFFSSGEWANYGYFIVTTGYCVGLIFWAALVPLTVRWLNGRRMPTARPKRHN